MAGGKEAIQVVDRLEDARHDGQGLRWLAPFLIGDGETLQTESALLDVFSGSLDLVVDLAFGR